MFVIWTAYGGPLLPLVLLHRAFLLCHHQELGEDIWHAFRIFPVFCSAMECDGVVDREGDSHESLSQHEESLEEAAQQEWGNPACLRFFVTPVLEATGVTSRTLQAMRVLFASFNFLHVQPAERGWKPIVKMSEGFAACKAFLQALVRSFCRLIHLKLICKIFPLPSQYNLPKPCT